MADVAEIEQTTRQAASEMEDLKTIDEVRAWWRKYYLTLGHRRLGRLLIGRSVESLLPKSGERED